MTQEEQDKQNEEWIETFSGLIRYGYDEAINEIREFIENKDNLKNGYSSIHEKLFYMEQNKKDISFEKLQKEINQNAENYSPKIRN